MDKRHLTKCAVGLAQLFGDSILAGSRRATYPRFGTKCGLCSSPR